MGVMKMETFQLFHFWQLHRQRDNLNNRQAARWLIALRKFMEMGNEYKQTNMLTNRSGVSHISACWHVVIGALAYNLISINKERNL